jgi:HEPN domain-containing protein
MKNAMREWVRKAEADLRGAASLSQKTPPLHDLVCFHCQQCAEKYLKALLEEFGMVVPKTHDLEQLQLSLLPHHPSLRSLGRGLAMLTSFAVVTRYPGDNATKRQAASALRWAYRMRIAAREVLEIRSRRKK